MKRKVLTLILKVESVMNPKWDLALQKTGLKAGGSASRFTFKYSRSHVQASSLTAKCSVGVKQHYEA